MLKLVSGQMNNMDMLFPPMKAQMPVPVISFFWNPQWDFMVCKCTSNYTKKNLKVFYVQKLQGVIVCK